MWLCAFVLFKRIFTWIECESVAAIKFILHRKYLFLDNLMGKHRLRYKYDLVHVASLVATIRLSCVVFIHYCNQPKSVAVRMHQLSVMFELWKRHTHTSFFFGSHILVCFSSNASGSILHAAGDSYGTCRFHWNKNN